MQPLDYRDPNDEAREQHALRYQRNRRILTFIDKWATRLVLAFALLVIVTLMLESKGCRL